MSNPRFNASAKLIYEEASKLGFEITTYANPDLLRISDGKKWVYTSGSRSSLQSSVGKTIADNKNLARKVLERAHFPVSPGGYIKSQDRLHELSTTIQYPVVAKPVDGRFGQDVFIGIQSSTELIEKLSSVITKGWIVEQMFEGVDFRILVIDYKFFAASNRVPAHVIGDGEHTIQELIDKENQNPLRGEGHSKPLTLITVDTLVENNLHASNLGLESVVNDGQVVYLRKTANLSTGGVAIDVTDEVCLENKELFEAVSREVDLCTIGIDVIAPTLNTPLVSQANAGIIEVNASPGLRMHHFPHKGKSRNAAQAILRMIF